MHPAAKRLHDHEVSGDETNIEYGASEFGGFGQYFRNKQIKLDTQLREANQCRSQIFKDCHIYLNGRTEPSHTILKGLIVSNGGSICAFLGGKTYATHIVAEHLTKRKNNQFANYKVVKPAWVVNCVNQGKLLDWTNYRAIESSLPTLDPKETQEQIILEEREKVNCLAPDYISSYYARSRLHFLSTKKAELRSKCQQLAGQLPVAERPSPRTILHIDFDSFFVAVALKDKPDLKDQPICVSWGGPSSDIASCNYKAREFGVQNGMWVSRALQLCPKLVCLSYNFDEYTRCSDVLYQEIVDLRPDYVTAVSVDEALVDVTSLCSKTDASQLAQELRSRIKAKTGIEASVGVAPNIFLAKMALRLAKPAGVVCLTQSSAPQRLANCSVRDLPGIGYHIAAKLADLGVTNYSHLKRVTENTLKNQLGNAVGTKLVDYLNCQDSDDISLMDQVQKSVGVELCWGVRLLNDNEVAQFTSNLTEELWSRVQSLYPETLTIKFYRRAADAPFVTPKYMGCGRCDVTSKTRRVVGLDLEGLKTLVIQCVQSFACPPMDMRGLGLQLRLMDTTTPTHHAIKFPQLETASRSTSPNKPKIQLPPSRRRGPTTLSQFVNQPDKVEVDMEVFDNLPSQIKREIMAHEDEFLVKVPSSRSRSEPAAVTTYEPVSFRGVTSEAGLRQVLRDWMRSAESPHYEDVCEFRDFVDYLFDSDWNWTKAISLVNYLNHCSLNLSQDWQYLAKVMQERVAQKILPIN
ncbi:DNA repair protein rev1 [Wickerhamiella sorbophila]|uniref:DNA repair protein REV1 n=1 Tax=Wickerhamiella sorbophila TaxID=45607 RepID=A0A2T0FNX7_9ASCO|nr:DNA repair protein rev1 [Wickerhamiella sorbophila]PRT56693.1 DNA repair protein rev1 [Wickerhamiella sorbophila]